ncbi:MAG: acyl--CoA ligase [Pseudonocardia sp.]|uniref:class I adenylate-forming enzyme family protein n=1 Tax=Pseudonocardia sp. TaxID=60912 RepID=UPI001ACD4D64|nr:class I adenylate-forming enzyme family protein [Pseudonocardia sp.]MBN9099847.1 acyl--CoA ligase [Pseudonocardia sp.]
MYSADTCLADLVDHAADPDAEALVFPDERVTYARLAELSRAFADRLCGLGVRPGDHVGLLLTGGLDVVVALLGAARLGAVTVPVNARYKAHELAYLVAHADLRVVVTSAAGRPHVDLPGLLEEALPGLRIGDEVRLDAAPSLRRVVLAGDADAGTPHTPGAHDVALILYTSGTTSQPKGCMLTHAGLMAQSQALGERLGLTPADRYWTPLPLFPITAISCLVAALGAGATFVHAGPFRPDAALRQLAAERITVANPAFETILLPVLDEPAFADTDLGALRTVFCVGVPARLAAMQRRLPTAAMISGFGSTEAGGSLSIGVTSDPDDVRLGTGGLPLPGTEVRVVDPETGREQPPGVPGEAWYRGPQRFTGYYRDPAYTATVIDADDWFHSGDICVMDTGGRLTFVTRLKDMLKVGGENVAPAEIEDYLAGHPAVQIVAVVGAPDARYGEVPAAFVQLVAGASPAEQDLIDFCRGRIATFKVPRYVRFVRDWPMSGTKIRKVELRERIARELAAAGITEAQRITSR